MASLRVLAFDHEGRPVQFDTWLDDLQMYLLSALYDAVVARYSSTATTALGRLLLPYLLPGLSAFATVEDLVSHLRASDARYRAAVSAEFLDRNPPPMDHFLSLDPTSLTFDLLEQHLLAAETSAVAVGAARGTPRPPFFEGCSPSPLAPSYASSAATDVSVPQDVGAASASAKRRSSKGKGGWGGGGGSGGGGGDSGSGGGGSSGGGGGGGTVGGSGGSGGGGGGSGGSGGSGGGGTGGGGTGTRRVGSGGGHHLLKSSIVIFDLDFDAILSAMYALSVSGEGDCYRCVPPDPGIAATALGATESGTLPGTAPAEALHTFTLDSGASSCFFRDSTTLTPLPAPVPVQLADPSRGSVVARSSTVLPCPALLSGSLSGLHLPSFSTNLVITAALQDAMVTTTTPGGQRVSICTSGSRLLLVSPPVAPDSPLAPPPGSPLSALLRVMHSWFLVSGLPRSLPPLPPSLAPPCLPCVEGRQRAAPHSSFPPTTAPLQTLHMDVWGPACVSEQSRERYFLLVVDDNTQYTTVFPMRGKGQVVDVLIPWIRTVRLQLREPFGQDLPVLRLHSDRGGEFSSSLLQDIFRGEGILQSFTLPDSSQQNGIAKRRIGLVMELNLWPRVPLPETLPTLRWTGKVGDASVFRVWGSRAFVRDTSADKLSPHAIPCVFLGFVPDAPGWKFYHPTSRHPLPGPAPVQVAVGPGAARGVASGGAESGGAESEGAETGGAEPGGVGIGGGEPKGAEPKGVEPGGAASEGAESGGAEPQGAASSGGFAGASPRLSPQQLCECFVRRARLRSGATGAGGAGAAGAGGAGVAVGAGVPGGTAATGPGGARTRGTGAAGIGDVEGARAGGPTQSGANGAGGSGAGGAGVGGAGTRGAGVGGTSVGGAEDGGAGALDPGGAVRPRLFFVPFLQQVFGTPSSTGLTPPLLCPPPDQSQPLLQPTSPQPAPSPYTEQSGGLTQRREPASCPVSPIHTTPRVPRLHPPPVPGTHAMTLRPSSVPLRVPLPPPPESSLPRVRDPGSDLARAASPTVSLLLATAVTDPSFESAVASALVAKLLDFATA
ncbi:unnamed protein product [Closterium sp. NIES-53]